MSHETPPGNAIPTTIGRYQIVGTLGFGAMGAVYKAFDPLIKRTLAIKTIRLDIPRQSPQHAAFIQRFYREARISGTLSHPNIVTLYDIGEEGGAPFLAMEFVDGHTIASVIEEGTRFKPEKVVALVSQVAAAVDYAHSRGVVHRDIKPSNLILHDEDKVKVTDFGIAKLADSEITHAGVLLGTPAYMSPEQAMGDNLDGRSDIFSLGVCAFEMLSGQQPFPGSNVTAILYRLVHVEPIVPADLEALGLVPQKWRDVFQKVLAKKPSERHPTATAFVRDLEECLGSWFAGLGEKTVHIPALAAAVPPAVPSAEPEAATVLLGGMRPADDSGATLALRTPPAAVSRAADTAAEGSEDAVTVVLKAPLPPGFTPSARDTDDAATVVLKTVPPTPPAGDIAKAEEPGGAADARSTAPLLPDSLRASGLPDDGATIVLMTPPGTGDSPVEPPPTMPPTPTVPQAVRPQRRGGRGWLVTAAIIGVVVMAGFFVWALWRRAALPSPSDAVALAPSSSPLSAPPSAEPAASAATASGSLFVESTPAGARVRVNGEPRGQTPLDLADLAFGSYEVRVELRGYEPQTQTVAIVAEQPAARVSVGLSRAVPVVGSASIVSSPAGAAVSVDGRPAGRTPLAAVTMKPGSHRVELTLEGHEPWTGAVDVLAGQKGSVEVRLRPRPKASPTPEAVDPDRVYAEAEVDVAPKLLSGPSASYPADGVPRLKSGERVSVKVEFIVTEKGDVRDLTVVASAGRLIDELVLDVFRKRRYQPARKQNVPVKCRVSRTQTFMGG